MTEDRGVRAVSRLNSGICARRLVWMAGSALAAMAVPALAAPAEVVTIGQSLTPAADLVSLTIPTLTLDAAPSTFGIGAPQRITGLDALGGNDVLVLLGNMTLTGSTSQARIYTNLPFDTPTLTLFTESPLTEVTLLGADGGAGDDSMSLAGQLAVTATTMFELAKLDMDLALPTTFNPDSLTAHTASTAIGLADMVGANVMNVSGQLDVTANVTTNRGELNLTLADLSNQPQYLTGEALATGLQTGASGDRLSVLSGGTVAVMADATALNVGVTIAGLVVGSPESAVVADSVARGLDAGGGHDILTNAGTIGATANATVTEVDLSAVAAGYTLPEILVPDVSPQSNGNARAFGMIGGLGHDRLTNSGKITMAADATYTRVGIAFTDAGVDGTAIETLIDPPTFPTEPLRGAVARIGGMTGDEDPVLGAGGGVDVLLNTGTITGTVAATMTTATTNIAVPINETTGFSNTGIGKLVDAISFGLSDSASAAAATYAIGLDGGAAFDTLTNSGSIILTGTAKADTALLALDVSDFLEQDDGGGGTGFSLSVDVFNTGAFAIAEGTGMDGGAGIDKLVTTAGSALSVNNTATARTLEAGVSVSSDERAFNLAGNVVFGLSLAGAKSVGLSGGADGDLFDSAGTILTNATALVQALKANLNVAMVESGMSLNAQMIEADLQATAAATGIDATTIDDQVITSNIINTASSDAESVTVVVNATVNSGKGIAGTGSFISSDFRSDATAIGIDRATLVGVPTINNAATTFGRTLILPGALISNTANSDLHRAGVGANVGLATKGVALGATAFELAAASNALAIGVRGSIFQDLVTSFGGIASGAFATSLTSETSFAATGAQTGLAASVGLVLADSTTTATARGVDLGDGSNTLFATGPIVATATSDATANGNTVSLGVAMQGVGAAASVTKMKTSSTADAAAVSGGSGVDIIQTEGSLAANATGKANIIAVSMTVSGAMTGVGAGAGVILADGTATANARGVDLGAGADRANLIGAVNANAFAELTGTEAAATVAGAQNGVGAGATVLSSRFDADARAAAASLGDGADMLFASRNLGSVANATTTVTSVAVTATGALNGVGAGAGVIKADVAARSDATTVDLGTGNDIADLDGPITAKSDATTRNTGAAVTLSGSNNGVAAGAAAVVNNTVANANARALAAGDGADTIALGNADANATTLTETKNIAVTVAGANNGVALGAAVVLADASSTARATTIDLGGGNDIVTLDGRGFAQTNATIDARSAGISLGGAVNGVGGNATVLDADTRAVSDAVVLSGGLGSDIINGAGNLQAIVDAKADSTSASLGVAATMNGVSLGASVLTAETAATAQGRGALLGDGSDSLILAGGSNVKSTATATNTSVGAQLSGSFQGVAAGVAVTDASTTAIAESRAADGGEGTDTIDFGGAIDSNATSTATNTGITASLGVSVFGVGAGGAGVLGTVLGQSTAFGLVGGAGNDTLIARRSMQIGANATAAHTSVAVSLGAALGVAVSASYIDSELTAIANATGLLGDGVTLFAGNDTLTSVGDLTVNSTATATGASFSFTVNLGAGAGGNLLTAGTNAIANATGQNGDDGNDVMTANGRVRSTATANATGSALSLTLAGANVGELSNLARANATGLGGGSGNDTITANRDVEAEAKATATANSIGIAFAGANIATISNNAAATAIGIAGGSGSNVVNSGAVTARATGTSTIETVSVQLTGATAASIGSVATAVATGVAGGGSVATITAANTRAEATADITSQSVSATLIGAAGQDTSLTSNALATAVAGADTGLTTATLGELRANATATAKPSTIDVTLTGISVGRIGTGATATANGYQGGALNDVVDITANARIDSRATADASSIGVSLVGGSITGTQLATFANSALAQGGNGGGRITFAPLVAGNETFISSTANSTASETKITLAGGINVTLGATATARTLGIGGGTGNDVFSLSGTVNGTATATASSNRDTLELVGVVSGRNRNIADAAIVAMEAGAGNDDLTTAGDIDLLAIATASNNSTAFQGAGATLAQSGLESRARATGVDGGTGNNVVRTTGNLTVKADARSSDRNASFTLAGANFTNLLSLLRASGSGIFTDSGADRITNSGTLQVDAVAGGQTGTVSLSLIGASVASNRMQIETLASGIVSGGGDDIIVNSGRLLGTATSTGRNSSLSASLIGIQLGNSDNTATALFTGIDAGSGADQITNSGELAVTSRATSAALDVNVTLAGGSATSARTVATTSVRGVLAGAGADTLINSGTINLTADSTINAVKRSLVLIGAATGNAGYSTEADILGIDGGEDNDIITLEANSRFIGTATSRQTSDAAKLNIIGLASSSGIGNSSANLLGIAGGAGDDVITVLGRLDLRATAILSDKSSNFNIVGATQQTGRFRANAQLAAFDGGSGNDGITIRQGANLFSSSTATYSASGFSAIGVSTTEASIGGSARISGVNGGTGNNTLVLNASEARPFNLTATANTTLAADTSVALGQATSNGVVSSIADASGFLAEGGNDLIVTVTPLEVIGLADVNFRSSTLAFIGASQGQTAALAGATANGVIAGDGLNEILLRGGGIIRATANADGTASAGNSLGNANVAAVTTGNARAVGLTTGSGVDTITLAGIWNVEAGATIGPRANADAGVLFSDGHSRAFGRSVLTGALVIDGGGRANITVAPEAQLTLTLGANAGDEVNGVTRADARSTGSRGGIDVDSFATADTRSQMTGEGISVGSGTGTHTLVNSGAVAVKLVGIADARAEANGNAGISGDGTAASAGIVSNAFGRGVSATSPMNFTNNGTVFVDVAPTALADARGLATGLNSLTSDPDGDATARAFASNVRAVGVSMAGGTLINSGDIRADSRPTATAVANGIRGNTGTSSTDGTAITEVRADDTQAIAVQSLSGFLTLNNSGRIDARALPSLRATSTAVGTGSDGDATSRATGTTNRTLAVGIDLGSGGSNITNSGKIVALANQFRLIVAAANSAGSGALISDPFSNGSQSTYGIRAAGGNNDITNTGDIDADIAIQTGAGNDTIRLLDGATTGRILTGAGDDMIVIDNQPFVGTLINMEEGSNDRLFINGPVVLPNGAANMEYVLKTGPGAAVFNTLEYNFSGVTRIESGSIQIVGGLFSPQHRLNTLIDPTGTHGALVVAGSTTFVPRGNLLVGIGQPGPFVDDTIWDVIQSNVLINTSNLSVTLPNATPTVSFSSSLAAGNTRYRVRVKVAKMSGLVSGGIERSFAAALDAATPIATGAVADTIQALQAQPTQAALQAAMTAAAPQALPLRSNAVGGAMLDGALAISAAAPSKMGFASRGMHGLMMLGQAAEPGGAGQWSAAFTALPTANLAVGRGAAGGFASGFSARPTDDLEYGIGAVMMNADQQFAGTAGGGFSQASMLTGRLAYAPAPNVTVTTAMALGVNRFTGSRQLLQGDTSVARQSGAMLALDGGLAWTLPGQWLQPTLAGGVSYRRVTGDGMQEGSSGMALLVAGSRWQRAEAQIGLQIAPSFALADAKVSTRLGAALVRRLGGPQATVQARFADMPDFAFTLENGRQALTAMRWDAGLDVALGRWNLSAGIASRPDVGGNFTEGQIGLGLRF